MKKYEEPAKISSMGFQAAACQYIVRYFASWFEALGRAGVANACRNTVVFRSDVGMC